jgi:DNA-binding MarR family transcriptional regulator
MVETRKARRDREIADVLDNLRRVFKVVHGYSKRAEKVGGMTGPQVWAMKVLAESAPIRVTDLARRMYLHPSTVVGILDRLEQQALVTRARSEKDHRVVTVSLTANGKETESRRSPRGFSSRGCRSCPTRTCRPPPRGCGDWSTSWAWKGCPPRSCCHRKSTRRR